MYAKVIVDVPAKQTDRSFDYIVPERMRRWIEIGSRVSVPFGARKLQGFVVDILRETDEQLPEGSKIKPIEEVLDIVPPLTRELVELSEWMSGKYLCYRITALQSMIPAALKAKYERRLSVARGAEQEEIGYQLMLLPDQVEIVQYIRGKGDVESEKLLEKFPGKEDAIKSLVAEGILEETQVVKDRMAKKKVLTVYPRSSGILEEQLAALPANAQSQKQILTFLIENHEPIFLSQLTVKLNVSASAVKALGDKGCLTVKSVESYRDPFADREFKTTRALKLTSEQQEAYGLIDQYLRDRSHIVFLLQGVTGSGKTEVYLQSIQSCIEQCCEAIVLVPEISLTPQMVERFKGRFGDLVAVLHSRLSHGERYDEWRKIRSGKVKVVVGARSAVFAPFTNIGLIIIDEEHEASYKQEDSPKYHARDIAIERAKHHRAAVVLGSATPSLETFYRAETSSFRLLRMNERVLGARLPKVEIVDMREELKAGNRSMFSRSLYSAIQQRLEKQEQMVLLLNRRGYSTFVMCRSCGYVAQCPHCEISLTYHRNSGMLRCHYCGYAEREKRQCPDCESEHIRYFGTGTQKVEEQLCALFPGIRVIRMDVDTTAEKGSHEKWLTQFRSRQADVLLGTQMVAKGLDFPYVTLVGVIAADTILNLPDFRAAEKTFQLLTQVAGRAGRHELPGEVVIQTYVPEHYSVTYAGQHDYHGFVDTELRARKDRGYPPYFHLILITLTHENVPLLIKAGETLAGDLKMMWNEWSRSESIAHAEDRPLMHVYGPVASPIPRIKDRYRFQCMVKYRGDLDAAGMVRQACHRLELAMNKDKLQIGIDVDPQMMM
jgi:primosomal protein N' (replication factor Y)